MSLLALALIVVAQVNDPAGDAPPLLDAPPIEKPAKPLEPLEPSDGGEAAPPVLTPKKKSPLSAPAPAPAPDVASDADDIAWAASIGGITTGVCSSCACGWIPFFGVPIVGVATAVGAAGGALYGSKDKRGWGTAILVNAGIAGIGGFIGAGVGTGLMAIAVFSAPNAGPNASPLVYGAIAGAVVLSAAGAVAGTLGGAYAIESFAPTDEEPAVPNAPRQKSKPVRPDDGKAIARY